jgi:hypothetical protein
MSILKATPDAFHALKTKQNAYLEIHPIANAFVALSNIFIAVSN